MFSSEFAVLMGREKIAFLFLGLLLATNKANGIRKNSSLPRNCDRIGLQLRRLNGKSRIGIPGGFRFELKRQQAKVTQFMPGPSKLRLGVSCDPSGCAMPREAAIPNEPSLEQFLRSQTCFGRIAREQEKNWGASEKTLG
jgi:hypothetical protein